MPEADRRLTLRRILLFFIFPVLLLFLAHLSAAPAIPTLTPEQEKSATRQASPMGTMFTLLGAKLGEEPSALKLADLLARAGDKKAAAEWRNFAEVKEQNNARRALQSLYVAIVAVFLSAWTALRTVPELITPASPESVSLAAMFIFLLSRSGPYSGEMVPIIDTICALSSLAYLASAFDRSFKMWRGAEENGARLFEAAAGVLMAVPWICWFLFWDNSFVEQTATTLAGGAAIIFPWVTMYRRRAAK